MGFPLTVQILGGQAQVLFGQRLVLMKPYVSDTDLTSDEVTKKALQTPNIIILMFLYFAMTES